MNKNGFISMTLVYTFLILFLFLMLAILTAYSYENKYLTALQNKTNDQVQVDYSYKKSIIGRIISDNIVINDNAVNFSSSADTSGLYRTTRAIMTDEGDSIYYYRGNVNNNYVYFGGKCYRIIRSTEYGAIKMMYIGTPTTVLTLDQINASTTVNCGSLASTPYSTSAYNSSYTSSKYVYQDTSLPNYTVGSDIDSTIKTTLETWYKNNLASSTNLVSKLSDIYFCNDTSVTDSVYNAKTRLTSSSIIPSFTCDDTDKYSHMTVYGNGKLNYPVATLTADELVMSGMPYNVSSTNSYLNLGISYYTMTPYDSSNVFIYNTSSAKLTTSTPSSTLSVIPVIFLSDSSEVKRGNGKSSDPYIIKVGS